MFSVCLKTTSNLRVLVATFQINILGPVCVIHAFCILTGFPVSLLLKKRRKLKSPTIMEISISSSISSNFCLVYFQPMWLITNQILEYFPGSMNDFFLLKHLSLSQVFSALNSTMMLILDKEMVTHSGFIPGSGRSPGEGHGNPLQYPCLENSRNRGAWEATIYGVQELDTTTLQPHDANTTIPIFWLVFTWNIFFTPFTFNFYMLYFRCVRTVCSWVFFHTVR